MIKDRLEFAENYFTISEKLKAGFDWLMTNDLVNLELLKRRCLYKT